MYLIEGWISMHELLAGIAFLGLVFLPVVAATFPHMKFSSADLGPTQKL
jgi:hypothetical protein